MAEVPHIAGLDLADLFEISLFFGLVVLLLVMLAGAVRFRPAKFRGLTWKQRLAAFGRYALLRTPLAIGFFVAIFVLGAAALTLNSHRPPADTDPVVIVPPGTRTAKVNVNLEDCGKDVSGSVTIRGRRGLAIAPIRFYSDEGGWQRLEPEADGRTAHATYTHPNPTQKRSLLSCYLQLPVVKGASDGYEVRLRLAEDMQVDRDESVRSPDAYSAGAWIWRCEEGKCPSFAVANYAVEDGTQQVIVLVLASIFGAIIALLVGEVLIEWSRKRFRRFRRN